MKSGDDQLVDDDIYRYVVVDQLDADWQTPDDAL